MKQNGRTIRYALENHEHNYDNVEYPEPPEGYFLRDDGEWVPLGGAAPDAGVDTRWTEWTWYRYSSTGMFNPTTQYTGWRGQIVPVFCSYGDANDMYEEIRCTAASYLPVASQGTWTFNDLNMNSKRFKLSMTFTGSQGRSVVGPEWGFLGAWNRQQEIIDNWYQNERVGIYVDTTTIYACQGFMKGIDAPDPTETRVELAPFESGRVYRFLLDVEDDVATVTVRGADNVDVSHTFPPLTKNIPTLVPFANIQDYNKSKYGKLYWTDLRVKTPIEGFTV